MFYTCCSEHHLSRIVHNLYIVIYVLLYTYTLLHELVFLIAVRNIVLFVDCCVTLGSSELHFIPSVRVL
jgi:hypothetical protein